MDVYERLQEAIRHLKEYESIQGRIESAQEMAHKAGTDLLDLEKQMRLEGKDLERLDNNYLVNIWHHFRGTFDQERQKEELEYLAAKLRYEQALYTLESWKRQVAHLEQELAGLPDPKPEYLLALKAKEDYLLKNQGPEAQYIFDLGEELAGLETQIQEVEEAITAGREASEQLTEAEKSWSSAQNWGALDILGGGMLVTAVKHSRINDGHKGLKLAQDSLNRFQRELQDVQKLDKVDNIKISIAADFLLDGFLFDIIVQSQISKAMERTRNTRNQVDSAVNELKQLQNGMQKRSAELRTKKTKAIENYGL